MEEPDNSSNTHEIEQIIEKLLSPVAEIRWRALQNILSKLKYGLISMNVLIELQSGKICRYLLKWFLWNSHSQPEFKDVLSFIVKIIKETNNGIRILINESAKNILQEWIISHIENEQLTSLVRNICSYLVTTTQTNRTGSDQNLQYGKPETYQDNDIIQDDSSIAENSITLSTNSISSPARFLIRNRDNYHRAKLPNHLLDPLLSTSDKSGAQSNIIGNRIYSPISRSYLKRKVTFSQLPEEEFTCNDDTTSDDSIINEIFPYASLLSEWHTIEKVDRDLLGEVSARLKNSETPGLNYTLQEISAFVLEDFPAELLLQRPDIIFSILDVLVQETNFSAKVSSVSCLTKIVKKLQNRLRFCSDAGFIGRTSCDQTFADTFLPSQDRNNDIEGFSEIEESYSDVINARELKRQQLLVHEFCLITMNNVAEAFSCVIIDEKDLHTALNLITASSSVFIETLSLLKMLGFSDKFNNRLSRNCKISHQILEVLVEISEKLSRGLYVHKEGYSKQNVTQTISYHRLSFISILQSIVKYRQLIDHKTCKYKLDQILTDSILDPTLYLSHEDLHLQISQLLQESESLSNELELFESAKNVMKSMAKCIKLFKNAELLSKAHHLASCNAALLCYEWHESVFFVSVFMKVCRNIKLKNQEEKEINLLSTTLVSILSHKDTRLRTTGYLELHNMIQDILGINRAIDIDGTRKHELQFLLHCPEVFQEIIQYGCGEYSHETKHINQAAQEIVLYLLKGKSVFGTQMWMIFIDNIVKPNTALLNSLIENDGSEETRSHETSFYLSKKIFSLFIPSTTEKGEKCDHDSIMDDKEALRSNIRLMFHKNNSVRFKANSNLKAMLSKEVNSYDKLPRFSEIIQIDLSESTKFVFNRDLNKLVNVEIDSSHLTPILLRNVPHEEENLETMKKVLVLLSKSTSDDVDSPDNDIQLRRAAISRLEILLEDEGVQEYFLSHNHNGISLLLSIWSKCITETNYAFVPQQFIPSILQCLSILAFRHENIRKILHESEIFLFNCLRSLYIFHKKYEIRTDIHCLLVAVLFDEHVRIETKEVLTNDSKCGIYLPKILSDRFYVPFQYSLIPNTRFSSYQNLDDIQKIDDLLKTFWNLAWFGCANELNGWKSTRINRNNENNGIDNVPISEKLQLSDRELVVIQVSDLLCCVSSSLNNLKNVNNHSEFHYQLQVLSACSLLPASSDSAKCLLNVDWKSAFQRFFSIKPGTLEDERLFISIVHFLSILVYQLNIILTNEARLEKNSLRTFLQESVLLSGAENILHFLTRTPKFLLEQNPRKTENLHQLILRGNEQVGKLIMHLVDFDHSMIEENSQLYSELIESFIQQSKESLPHCHWHVKVIAKILMTSDKMSENLGISKCSRLLSKSKDAFWLENEREKVKSHQLFLGSNITINSSKIIRKVLEMYSMDDEKTKRIILESFNGIRKLNWLFTALWQNRNTYIRTLGLSISNVLSYSVSGSEYLTSNKNSNESFWLRQVSVFLDRTECPNARSESLNTMTDLLKRSAEDSKKWFGPTFVEPVSKLLVDGEGALFQFFDRLNLHREIIDIFQTFASQHSPKLLRDLNTVDESVIPHSNSESQVSFDGNVYTKMSDKSSTGNSQLNFVTLESPITPSLITSILKLLQVMITLEIETSKEIIDQLNENSLLPHFDTKIIPAIIGLCYDATDPRTQKVIRKNIDAINKQGCYVYSDMTLQYLKLLSTCLRLQVKKKAKNQKYETITDMMKLMIDNDYTCQSMMVNTVYYFFNSTDVQNFHKINLIAALFQQISLLTLQVAPIKDTVEKNNLTWKHSTFNSKYMTAFLDMTIFVLTFEEMKNGKDSRHVDSTVIINVLHFIAKCFQSISAARNYGTLLVNNFCHKDQKLIEKLCHILLSVHAKTYISACKKYDATQKRLINSSINLTLLEMFSVNTEVKMIYMLKQSENKCLQQSHLIDTLEKLGIIEDRFKSALNSRRPSSAWINSWWTELEMILSLLNNLCFENLQGKDELIRHGIMEKLLKLWTVLIKVNAPLCPPIELVKFTITNILKLLTTLTCDCESAKSALTKNYIIYNESSVAKDNPQQNFLQHLMNLCKSNERNINIKMFQSIEGQNYFTRTAYPLCLRIIMSSLTNKECRLNILRSKFPESCLEYMEFERDQRHDKHRKKTATEVVESSAKKNYAILWFDFMLSLTTFPDGQIWLGCKTALIDTLLDITAIDIYNAGFKLDLSGLAALAILRNISFHPLNRTRLLLSKKFLRSLAEKVLSRPEQKKNLEDVNQEENIALSAIWALVANNHKGKVAFANAGITKLLKEESHRREVECELKAKETRQTNKVTFYDDKENLKSGANSMLKEVLHILKA